MEAPHDLHIRQDLDQLFTDLVHALQADGGAAADRQALLCMIPLQVREAAVRQDQIVLLGSPQEVGVLLGLPDGLDSGEQLVHHHLHESLPQGHQLLGRGIPSFRCLQQQWQATGGLAVVEKEDAGVHLNHQARHQLKRLHQLRI